jgi:protease-4
MGFDQDHDYLQSSFLPGQDGPKPPSSSPPPPPPPPPPYQPFERPRRRISGWRILWSILFALSVLANVGLFLMLVGLVAFVATGQTGRLYDEVVVREGPRGNKIVLVNIEGMIHSQQADNVYRQLDTARRDRNVKALIVRVNSPGGTISGSDRIYQEINRYREDTGQPVVAFMEGVAASGGYYASVACDKIVAEPTAVTGSIGVVMSYFVLQELLENKLGIQPVFLAEGEKKDWPSSFRKPAQEELDYIQERLLTPAYERFVSIVEEGRADTLSAEQVKKLADGSIYGAPRALAEKLIDQIGYLDDAITTVKTLASVENAQVVEYRRPFSFADILSVKTANTLKFNRATLYELSTPEVLYLWKAF